ncbi:MAG: hypothetical protein WDZ64_00565 [Parcubacteria group bacterium]
MVRPSFNIEWEAHEYEHKERSSDWYWAVGIVSVAIAIASVIFGNIIFGILILVGAFTLSLFVNKPPSVIRISIDEKGVTKNRVHYPFSSLQSFWVDIEHSHKKIILRSQKLFMPLIIIPLGEDTDPERIHRILSRFLNEEYHSLPLVESVLEYLGF